MKPCVSDRRSSTLSYLNMPAIISAAEVTDAEAIHPGYGFLSENADFAERVEQSGFTFIGPRPETIRLMGDKVSANKMMKTGRAVRAGFGRRVAGRSDGTSASPGHRLSGDHQGSGRRRRARHARGAHGSRARERGEHDPRRALAAFGNPQVYMEKFLENPRHIEIQILADNYGDLVLGERDCSMQRRHQKVIEEAPAPGMTAKQRKTMGDRCAGCREVGYRSAGTFEFLYEDNEFYFIEMNTRVQVEHPVTELVTGIDIVKEQILDRGGREAALQPERHPVPRPRDRMPDQRRRSVEVRALAGPIRLWHSPGGPGIRVDSHAYNGYFVPPNYDSMIGKLIAYGATRETAINRMRIALSEMVVEGIKTNIPLHQEIFNHSAFRQGGTDIHYLERRLGLK